ncbi:MAG: hypothetical protein M1379_04845 [Firmicutes bacterium]|nr:hypothetical protein [Bacillota bacterium]
MINALAEKLTRRYNYQTGNKKREGKALLFNIVEIHKCPACGKEFGFTEIYSHDHDNIREREVRYRPGFCPACRAKPGQSPYSTGQPKITSK